MASFPRQFLDDSRAFLTHDYLPKIERCVQQLTPEQIWSRANEATNSIGNRVYHVVGHFSMHTGQILSMAKSLVGELASTAER